jgi:hypothetical protein
MGISRDVMGTFAAVPLGGAVAGGFQPGPVVVPRWEHRLEQIYFSGYHVLPGSNRRDYGPPTRTARIFDRTVEQELPRLSFPSACRLEN